MVDNIWLTQNLIYVLRVQRTCNSTIRFSKYVIIFILLSKVVTLGWANFVTKFYPFNIREFDTFDLDHSI